MKYIPILLLICIIPLFGESIEMAETGWEYSWGGIEKPTTGWMPYSLDEVLPGRGEEDLLWIRYKLPNPNWERPAIYFDFIEFSYQAYILNETIASFNPPDADGKCSIKTWIQHQILPIKQLHFGEYIYLKICSPISNIGISGIPKIGNIEDLHYAHIKIELSKLVYAIVFFTFGILGLILFIRIQTEKQLFHISMLSLIMSIITLYHTEFRLEIFHSDYLWTSILVFCVSLLPYFLIQFTILMTGNGWKNSLVYAGRASGIIASGLFIVLLFGVDWKYQKYLSLPFLLLQIPLIIIFIVSLTMNLKNHKENAIIILCGVILMFISILPTLLYEFSITRYTGFYLPIGALFFITGLSWIGGNRYFRLNKMLKEYNNSLEKTIALRTKEIEDSHDREIQRERELARLENENALNHEREKIFRDIHDHIGSDMMDLLVFANQMKDVDGHHQAPRLLDLVQRIISGFKSRLHIAEDMKLIESDFLTGLRLIVLHRYEASRRRIILECCEKAETLLHELSNVKFKEHFFYIVMETVTNDLKYGQGNTESKIFCSEGFLHFVFNAKSVYNSKSTQPGLGHKNLINRINSIKGNHKISLENDGYTLQLQVPEDAVYA